MELEASFPLPLPHCSYDWLPSKSIRRAFQVAQWKRIACQCWRHKRRKFNPWVGKIPWRRKWQPTPVFLPENSMDRGAWYATVHGVAKSRPWLSTCTHPPQAFPQLLRRTKTANRILWLPLRMKTELGLVHHCIPKMWVRRYFTNFSWMNWYEMSHFFSSDMMLPYILRLIRVIESPLFANKADSSSKQVDGNNLYLEPF